MFYKLVIFASTTIPKSAIDIPKAEANNAQFQSIFGAVLMAAGAAAVIFIILGGIRYAVSQGNAGELQKAKDTIVYALVGLVFVVFAFTIVQFVTARLF